MMPVQVRTDDDLLDRAMLTPADLSVVTSGAVGRQVRRPVACAAPIAYNWGSPATAGLWRVDVRDGAGGGSWSTATSSSCSGMSGCGPGWQCCPPMRCGRRWSAASRGASSSTCTKAASGRCCPQDCARLFCIMSSTPIAVGPKRLEVGEERNLVGPVSFSLTSRLKAPGRYGRPTSCAT